LAGQNSVQEADGNTAIKYPHPCAVTVPRNVNQIDLFFLGRLENGLNRRTGDDRPSLGSNLFQNL
jgi:hypothetical protein